MKIKNKIWPDWHMQILKLCRFRKACKGNLIKFRETEIQRHIWNPVKHKIELL